MKLCTKNLNITIQSITGDLYSVIKYPLNQMTRWSVFYLYARRLHCRHDDGVLVSGLIKG